VDDLTDVDADDLERAWDQFLALAEARAGSSESGGRTWTRESIQRTNESTG